MSIGFPDFTSPVGLIDRPNQIGLELNRTVPFTTGVQDVRGFQSFQLSVQYEAPNAGPPARTCRVTLEWGDTLGFSNITHAQEYEINSTNSTDCGRTIITDRMHGAFMRMSFAAGNGAASTITLVLYGSTRPVDRARVAEIGATPSRGMSTDNTLLLVNGTIGPGVTINRNVRLGRGPATLHYNFRIAGGPFNVILYSPYLRSVLAAHSYLVHNNVPLGTERSTSLHLPRRVLTCQIDNTGGAGTADFDLSLVEDD